MDAATQSFILGFRQDEATDWQDGLIDGSRDPEAPTHTAFEWDDSLAAQRDRRRIAAELIARVRIIAHYVTESEPDPVSVRAVFMDAEEHHYRMAPELREEPESVIAVVVRDGRYALGHLRSWLNNTAGNFGFALDVPDRHWQALSRWLDAIERGSIKPTLPTVAEMARRRRGRRAGGRRV